MSEDLYFDRECATAGGEPVCPECKSPERTYFGDHEARCDDCDTCYVIP